MQYTSTALILAARCNSEPIVEALLSVEASVNLVDKDGCSALYHAAREGYVQIAQMLLDSAAFVNVKDAKGDPLVIAAVRGGNVQLLKALLAKFADVNAQDGDGRTALHLAVDKGYADMVLALCDYHPNLELKNASGETALMRAVINRNVLITQLLIHSGAKVAVTDINGDNCLHIALRSRSRRLTQILLSKPSDARLLYRPNAHGETPYSIDQANQAPILPSIFGPVESDAQTDAMLGYDVYANVLADIFCEPNLSLPLSVGLYAKWGSGKSFLLVKIRESIRGFSRNWLDAAAIYWSWSIVALILCVAFALSMIVYLPMAYTTNSSPGIGFAVGSMVAVLLTVAYGTFAMADLHLFPVIIYYFGELHDIGNRVLSNWAQILGRAQALITLTGRVLFYHPPRLGEKELISCPVSFLFADYHRLSSIGGEQALAKIVTTLFNACERHYGWLSVRLCCAFKPQFGERIVKEIDCISPVNSRHAHLRRICGIPVVVLTVAAVLIVFAATWIFGYALQLLQRERIDELDAYEHLTTVASTSWNETARGVRLPTATIEQLEQRKTTAIALAGSMLIGWRSNLKA